MPEELEKLAKKIKELTERLDAVEPKIEYLEKIEKEEREDLIEQAKKLTGTIPDSVIEKMSRCDLKQTIAKNTKPAAEIPPSDEDKEEFDPQKPFELFPDKPPEGWH